MVELKEQVRHARFVIQDRRKMGLRSREVHTGGARQCTRGYTTLKTPVRPQKHPPPLQIWDGPPHSCKNISVYGSKSQTNDHKNEEPMTKLEGKTSQNNGRVTMVKLLCRALAGSAVGVTNGNNTASLGNMYSAILPRPVGYFTFIHSNKTFFTRIATSQYTKSLYQSTLVVLWPSPLRFSFDRPY